MSIVLLLALLLLLFLNGFFVAAEFALVRSRGARMEEMANQGQHGASRALRQMRNMDEYVATCQVGITVASIGIGFLGESALASLLEPLLGNLLSHGAAIALAVILSYLLITLAHVIIGEQAPKMIAISTAERTGRLLAGPLDAFRLLFKPLVTLTNAPARWLVSGILRIPAANETEMFTFEELRLLVNSSARAGGLEAGQARQLEGVFHLHEQTANQVMTPMPSVVSVDENASLRQALKAAADSGRSRLLVQNKEGGVEGIVLVSALIKKMLKKGDSGSIRSLIQSPLYVPEGKPLDELFNDLQQGRSSFAVVLDEYGSPVGICTAEDIVEEAVGEIRDENDNSEMIASLDDGIWEVRGETPLGDLQDIGIILPCERDITSVGGLVFHLLGRLPVPGDRLERNGWVLKVKQMERARILRLQIKEKMPKEKGSF